MSRHPLEEIRLALRTWAFSMRLRGKARPPENIAAVVRWLETATIPVSDLAKPGSGPARTRALLDRISKKRDGRTAGPQGQPAVSSTAHVSPSRLARASA